MAPKIMAGLMAERDPRSGGRWTTTHANAWALMAASRYYAAVEGETPDYVARIWLDDMFAGEARFAGRDMAKVNQQVPMRALLGKSVSSVTLGKEGPGSSIIGWGCAMRRRTFTWMPVDRGFGVSRRYEALANAGEDKPDPDAVRQLDDGDWSVKAGTNVEGDAHADGAGSGQLCGGR